MWGGMLVVYISRGAAPCKYLPPGRDSVFGCIENRFQVLTFIFNVKLIFMGLFRLPKVVSLRPQILHVTRPQIIQLLKFKI
jgi:hypothetical protein